MNQDITKKENLVYVLKILFYIKKKKNGMKFENLTYAPIDKNLIIKNLLKKRNILA